MPSRLQELYLGYHRTSVVQIAGLRRILQTLRLPLLAPPAPSAKGLQLRFLQGLINSYLREGKMKLASQANLHFDVV